MKFEGLREFNWYNEPENVVFGNDELKVVAQTKTDFWQSRHHNFAKDDGHLFYCERPDNFTCLIKWSFAELNHFNQAGLMIRFDAQNWFKISAVSPDSKSFEVATFTTRDGYTDWAETPLDRKINTIWYQLRRFGDDYAVSYSLDGENFINLRRFYLPSQGQKAMVGAYICAPQDKSFAAVLKEAHVE